MADLVRIGLLRKSFHCWNRKQGPKRCISLWGIPSTTYKLKLNHGDLKVTQGDTGHAEIDMITKVYAPHSRRGSQDQRTEIRERFLCKSWFEKSNTPQEQPQAQTIDLAALIEQLQKSPELANTLAALIAGQKAVWNLKLARTSFLFVSN